MARQVLPFQIRDANDVAGLVTQDNLEYMFESEPQKASKVALKIKEANIAFDMDSYLSRFPTYQLDNSKDFTWDLITGVGDKTVALVKATTDAAGSTTVTSEVGGNRAVFYLWFSEGWFFDQNILIPEDDSYPMRVDGDPVQIGELFRYKVQLATGDSSLSIPADELAGGTKFSKEFSPVSTTLSKKGAGIHHEFPYKMLQSVTMIRMEDTVPGDMIDQNVITGWRDKNGNVQKTWLNKWSYDFDMQFQREINFAQYYAQSNKSSSGRYDMKDKSGYYIKIGAGVREQIRSANNWFYNTFKMKKFAEMIIDLSIGKLSMSQRELTISSGEFGMLQWSEALEELPNLFVPNQTTQRISKGAGSNALRYQGQFLEYWGPNGVKLNIVHDPTKDDPARAGKFVDGYMGKLDSYTYDILNMGTSDGRPNIQKIAVKNGMVRGYMPGMRHPYQSTGGNNLMATPVDGWTEHKAWSGGAIVWDPTTTATYRFNA